MSAPKTEKINLQITNEVTELNYKRECHNMRQALLMGLASWRVAAGVDEGDVLQRTYDSLPDQYGRIRSIEIESVSTPDVHAIVGGYSEAGDFEEYDYKGKTAKLTFTKRTHAGEIVGEPTVMDDDVIGLSKIVALKNIMFDCEKREQRK